MKELPEAPFYFKTIFSKDVSTVVSYSEDKNVIIYNVINYGRQLITVRDFLHYLARKTWFICDKNGNKVKEEKMKYITRDKDYTGCPKEIAELLKQGKTIKGVFSDHPNNEDQYAGMLHGFYAKQNYCYVTGSGATYKHFTPTPAKQSTTNVRTLIKNGVKIPVDTKVLAWDDKGFDKYRRRCNRYFARCSEGVLYAWMKGCTEFSADGEVTSWDNMELLEPIEYTPKEG